MSGDSPNALSTENVFEFKEGGRTSPAPTTSKEPAQSASTNNVVTASVLVEPLQKDIKSKRDDGNGNNDEDTPDFQLQSPTMNQDQANNTGKQIDDNKYDNGESKENNKEELNLLNGLDRLPNTRSAMKNREDEDDEDNQCIVNCIYYTMECCKCSII